MNYDQRLSIILLRLENERLLLENWQLKGALGYGVPADIPNGNFRCGMCDARKEETLAGVPQGRVRPWVNKEPTP